MRVTHDNIEDLLADIREERDAIYQKVVRVRAYRLDEHEGDENRSGRVYLMGLWVTALVRHDDGDWCIEFGEAAGHDTTQNPDAGTNVVNEWRLKLELVCKECGLTIRPGKYEVF